MGRLTVNKYVNVLHRGPRNLIYICDYRRAAVTGPYTALYTWGPSEADVPKPAPLSRSLKDYKRRAAAKIRTQQTEKGLIHRAI